jgi:hypothetical protein
MEHTGRFQRIEPGIPSQSEDQAIEPLREAGQPCRIVQSHAANRAARFLRSPNTRTGHSAIPRPQAIEPLREAGRPCRIVQSHAANRAARFLRSPNTAYRAFGDPAAPGDRATAGGRAALPDCAIARRQSALQYDFAFSNDGA